MLSTRAFRVLATACITALSLTACQGSFPADSQGTLDRASGGELRVGVSANPPFTVVAADGSVSGSEIDLVEDYAERIDSEIVWTTAGENTLAASMSAGELDLVVGGLAADVPWTSDIALTRPYTSTTGLDGSTVKIVMGVTPGENALLVDLERFLAEESGEL